MRTVNTKLETIAECDLTAGKLITIKVIREDAAPINNTSKFAWSDEDYEEVQMYIPDPEPAPPRKLDIIEAQVTYTAMMTDTLLEV